MRNFVIVGHLATTAPAFSLDDIPGTSGRLDILCRCINSSFFLSHEMRRDVTAYLVLCGGDPHKSICMLGMELRHLNPDERTTAALLKKALAVSSGFHWARSTPGIFIREGGLEALLSELEGRLYYLREDGCDIRKILECPAANAHDEIFVLGDHLGMTALEEDLLFSHGAVKLCVGPKSLHADHCIILINNSLDRRNLKGLRDESSPLAE